MSVDLSIIVPCRDCADLLREQLDALSEQKWSGSWEVIVADNGSKDNTRAVAESYAGRLPNLKVVDASERPGAAHARNKAASLATGTSLAFCDADDVVGDGWVAAIGTALQEHDFVASRFDTLKLNGSSSIAAHQCGQQYGVQQYRYPRYLPHTGGCGMGVKRALFEEIGGFDESMPALEDTDFCWRLQLRGVNLEFAGDALMHIRLRPDNKSLHRQARLWGQYNVLIYKKYLPHGMPRLSLRMGVKKWVYLLIGLVRAWRSGDGTERWLWHLHWNIGRLVGSIKYRVIAL